MKALFKIILFTWIISSIIIGCAKIGAPTGGPTDTIPPILVNVFPANKSINSKPKKIVFNFDEYIKITNQSQIIITPPLLQKPIISPIGGPTKKISIQFVDSLKSNTTYSINFGNVLVDNNEGNSYQNLRYVFSTGKYIDSLYVKGTIKNPVLSKKENPKSILIFDTNDVTNTLPIAIGNIDAENNYKIENLKKGNYQIIALEDINNNYKYDQGLEKIAFLQDKISLEKSTEVPAMTFFKEKLPNKIFHPIQGKNNQLILDYDGDKPEITIEHLNPEKYHLQQIKNKDSIICWYKNILNDSITIKLKQKNNEKTVKLLPKNNPIDSLTTEIKIKSIMFPTDTLRIYTNHPIKTINQHLITIKNIDEQLIDYNLSFDSCNLYFDLLLPKFPFDQQLEVSINNKAIVDFYDLSNQQTSKKLKTPTTENLAELRIQLEQLLSCNLLVNLFNLDNNQEYNYTILKGSNEIKLSNLIPGKYSLQLIKDLNNNLLFDNGNFEKQIIPEPIINFEKTLTLRANSEVNEILKID